MMSALGPFLLLTHVRMEAELLRTGGGVTQQTLWNTDPKRYTSLYLSLERHEGQ